MTWPLLRTALLRLHDVICPPLRVIGTGISGWGDRGSGSATGPFYPFICQTAGHCSLSLIIAVLVATGA